MKVRTFATHATCGDGSWSPGSRTVRRASSASRSPWWGYRHQGPRRRAVRTARVRQNTCA